MFSILNKSSISTSDLRAISTYNGSIAITSRDGNIHIQNKESITCLSPQVGQLSCLYFDKFLLAGSQMGNVVIYTTLDTVPNMLKAHTQNVSCIDQHLDQVLAGSWDNTITLSNINTLSTSFKQEFPACVWTVNFLKSVPGYNALDFIVGCADGTIHIFKDNKPHNRFKVHCAPIRGLAIYDYNIYSVGNDGKVIKTDLKGKILKMHNLDELMYSLKIGDGKFIIVTGENGKVGILDLDLNILFDKSVEMQSCWDSVFYEGEIKVIGSKGVIITIKETSNIKEDEAIIDSNTSKELNIDCNEINSPISNNESRNEKNSLNSNSEILNEGNNDPEQNPILKDPNYKIENGKVFYKENGEWNLIGDVVDKKVKEEAFDYNIDVEVEDKNLKIRFMKKDNIYEVAEKFLSVNSLSQEYYNQIVEFIKKNLKPEIAFFSYDTIKIDGIKKFVTNEVLVDQLENPCLENNFIIEEILKELYIPDGENFYVIDCYRFFVSRGFIFDFIFLQDYIINDRRSALAFVRLITNLYRNEPYCLEMFENRIDRAVDQGFVDENTRTNYKHNQELRKR